MKKIVLALVAVTAMSASVYGSGYELTPKFMIGGSKTFISSYVLSSSETGLFGANIGGQFDVDFIFDSEWFGLGVLLGVTSFPYGISGSLNGLTYDMIFSCVTINLGVLAKFFINNLSFGIGFGSRSILSAKWIEKINGNEIYSTPLSATGSAPYFLGSIGYRIPFTKAMSLLLEANLVYNIFGPTMIEYVSISFTGFDFGASAGVVIKVF